MEILKIAAIAITGVLLAALIKNTSREISLYVIFATAILIVLAIIDRLAGIFIFLEDIYDNVTYGREFFPVIIKVLAVAYITDFTAQLCKDAGENSVGSKVELAGKITIFYIAMPILTSILGLIKQLLG
ncbi:MAG: SpoIIIAC/SpoIIIAD family protein [Anaerovoracaceae bacterium]|nr:SpoIIIAC/SpoIIIAD family protein [Anaerovoracaceae bacterium]